MQRIVKILGVAFLLVGVALLLVPLVYWFNNPELTYMELFLIKWRTIVFGFLLTSAGRIAIER